MTTITVEIRNRTGRKIVEDKNASMEQVGSEIIISAAMLYSDNSVLVIRAEKDFFTYNKAEDFYLEIVRCGGITKRMLRALSFNYQEASI